jgi:F0F1-type ATP synthase membrane subunit a
MKKVLTLVVAVVYILALFYLLMGTLGFGLRIGGNIYAEEGFGSLRATYFALLILLACGGVYFLWRITRRSV